MKKIKLILLLLAATPVIFLTSCKKEMNNASASTMKFNITDAPANFDALNIDVQGVLVHTGTGWITLHSSLGVVNILDYVNGNSAMAAQGQINAGTVDQVKLMLGPNNSIVVNGTTYPLKGSLQSGITANLNGQLQAGGNYTWTIDFDAAQSITSSGSGSFQLNPVIRLIVDSANLSAGASGSGSINASGSGSGNINLGGGTSGSGSVVISGSSTGNITGSISPAGLASVCVSGSNGSSVCTMTNLSGQFSLQAIGTGSYTLTITPVLPTVAPHTLSNVSVTSGATTNVGVVSM